MIEWKPLGECPGASNRFVSAACRDSPGWGGLGSGRRKQESPRAGVALLLTWGIVGGVRGLAACLRLPPSSRTHIRPVPLVRDFWQEIGQSPSDYSTGIVGGSGQRFALAVAGCARLANFSDVSVNSLHVLLGVA